MAIKLPKSMVYYSESRSEPESLLCWIPPQDYPDVARDAEALEELRRYYPQGIEVEVSEEALEAEGIELGPHPADLRTAYVQLHEANMTHESGMITAEKLLPIVWALQRGASIEELRDHIETIASVSSGAAALEGIEPVTGWKKLLWRTPLVEGTDVPPETTGDEDAKAVFRRLSVR